MVAAAIVLGACSHQYDVPSMPVPVFNTPFEPEDVVFEGQPAHFRINLSNATTYTVERSDDSGFHYRSLVSERSPRGFPPDTVFITEPVYDARDGSAIFRISAMNEAPTADRQSSEASDGPVGFKHIVRITAFELYPGNAAAGVGGSARFSGVVRGERLVYQWQRSDDAGLNWRDLPGANADTLQIDGVALADDGALLRLHVQGWNGDATSFEARLTVTRTPPVVFHEEVFASADWAAELLLVGRGGQGAVLHQPGTGGNPGEWGGTSIWVYDAAADAPAAVYLLNWQRAAVYDPRSSGAIISIDYSEDQRREFGAEQSAALIARQAGHLYYAAATAATETAWTTKARRALGVSDFALLRGPEPRRAIDFSAAGAPIEFGFLRANNAGAGTTTFTTVGGIDNWSVTVWR
jgi:hypothetical protein